MRSRLKTAIGISFAVLVAIVLHFVGVLASAENALRSGLNVSAGFVFRATKAFREPRESFASTAELRAAYEGAKVEIARARAVREFCELVAEENAELRETLSFVKRQPLQLAGAEVIGRDIEPIGSTLILSRGARDGIRAGQAVIAREGIFLGRIVRAEEDMSVVRLVSDGASRIPAAIMNRDRSIGVVEGGYGISVRLTLIPQNEIVLVGDRIVTSGAMSGIPRGLIIGTVEAVEKEPYQPFQRAALTPAVRLDKITIVSVIVGPSTTAALPLL